jgi:hypothetical protein
MGASDIFDHMAQIIEKMMADLGIPMSKESA